MTDFAAEVARVRALVIQRDGPGSSLLMLLDLVERLGEEKKDRITIVTTTTPYGDYR